MIINLTTEGVWQDSGPKQKARRVQRGSRYYCGVWSDGKKVGAVLSIQWWLGRRMSRRCRVAMKNEAVKKWRFEVPKRREKSARSDEKRRTSQCPVPQEVRYSLSMNRSHPRLSRKYHPEGWKTPSLSFVGLGECRYNGQSARNDSRRSIIGCNSGISTSNAWWLHLRELSAAKPFVVCIPWLHVG